VVALLLPGGGGPDFTANGGVYFAAHNVEEGATGGAAALFVIGQQTTLGFGSQGLLQKVVGCGDADVGDDAADLLHGTGVGFLELGSNVGNGRFYVRAFVYAHKHIVL
jgi:hypothetical protein